MRQELRKILARVFVALLIFLIGVVIYKQGNPYAYPELENRILFVLVPSGIVLLYLYLEERETRNRLISVIMVTIGRLYESKFMSFCESIWERSPSLVHVHVSKVLAVVYTYLHEISGYMLKQDPKEVVSHFFLGMLLIVALQSIFPQPSLEWARTPVMIAAVVLGVVTFYLNRDKLGEIEDEARQEEVEEKRREVEFGAKYPRINRVWGVRWVVRWMYKEGWWYSVGLILIIFVGLCLRIILAKYMIITIDEAQFTHSVSLGWVKYNQIGTTLSGATYHRTEIYNLLNTIPYYFVDSPLLKLRLFNIIIFSIITIPLYSIIKKIFKNKKVALLSIFLISINWYIIATTITARSYFIAGILSLILIYICYIIYIEKSKKQLFGYLILLNLVFLINFIVASSVFALHILPILFIIMLMRIKDFSLKDKYLISGILCFFFVGFILFYLRNDVVQYALEKFTLDFSNPYCEGLIFQGSVLSYINEIGLLILILIGLCPLIYFLIHHKNFNLFLYSLYISVIPILQIFLFGGKNTYPRYLFDLTIPVLILTSYFIVFFLKKKRFYKILAYSVLILIISTSLVNINNLYREELEWQPFTVKPWKTYLEQVPENGTVISDFAGIPSFYRPDLKMYWLKDNPYDGRLVDINGENGENEDVDEDIIDREENKHLFKRYIEKHIINNYIVTENQLYYHTDGIPRIMSVEHLKAIVLNSNNQTVYFILSHNAYDRKNQKQNPELYEFIFENSILINEKFESRTPFDNRIYDKEKKVLSILVIDKALL